MSPNDLPFDRRDIRRSDGNSLLRMYDRAAVALRHATSQCARERAGKARRRIAQELRKRDVAF
jgi:hypothetical protein